jgi:hypothetical protein
MTGYSTAVLTAARIENEVFSINANDPNGMFFGWKSLAPQGGCGYADNFDSLAREMLGFNIHATRFVIGEKAVLRLWKGYYGGVIGGEIGIYGRPEPTEKTNKEMKGMVIEAFKKAGLLLGVEIRDIDKETKESAEKLRSEMLDSLFKSDKLRDNNNVPLLGQKNVIENIMKILISPNSFTSRLRKLYPIVTPETFDLIITRYQQINFIVESIKNYIKLKDGKKKFSEDWGHSFSGGELNEHLGLTGTAVQVFYKRNGELVTEQQEQEAKFWTTAFAKTNLPMAKTFDFLKIIEVKNRVYTVNHFYFKNKEHADFFYKSINNPRIMKEALDYEENKSEKISIPSKPNDTTVIILYGK